MRLTERNFEECLKGLLPHGEAVLLAVSGGIDSITMAELWLRSGRQFAVAHCNFHLRGEESDGDEVFVREWCRKHGVPVYVADFDTVGYAEKCGISIEMAARELRYNWFAKLVAESRDEASGTEEMRLAAERCHETSEAKVHAVAGNGEALGTEGHAGESSGKSQGAEKMRLTAVAVAHNANDNAETLILNLLRGTGLKGMCGISADSTWSEGEKSVRVIRPLLGFSRADIETFATENGIAFRTDSTNADSTYKRNLVRNEIFPLMKRINPSFIETLGREAGIFSGNCNIIEEYLAKESAGIMDIDGNILVGPLMQRPHRGQLLWWLLQPYNIDYQTLEALKKLLGDAGEGRGTLSGHIFQTSGYELVTTRDRIIIRRIRVDVADTQQAASKGKTEIQDNRTDAGASDAKIRHQADSMQQGNQPATGKPHSTWHPAGHFGINPVVTEGKDSMVVEGDGLYDFAGHRFRFETISATDLDTLIQPKGTLILGCSYPLLLRRWQNGDWMRPFGMKGRKKVSDLLTEQHVDIITKQDAVVLVSPEMKEEGRIAALLPYRIDDSLKINRLSSIIIRITEYA